MLLSPIQKLLAYAAGVVVFAALVVILAAVMYWRGHSQGYDKRVAEVAAQDAKVELRRKGEDARLQGLSDYALCVDGLGRNGMPVDACEQLRGLQQEQSISGGNGRSD